MRISTAESRALLRLCAWESFSKSLYLEKELLSQMIHTSTTDWVAHTTEIYFLTVLEARSTRSKCQGLASPVTALLELCVATSSLRLLMVGAWSPPLKGTPLILHYGPYWQPYFNLITSWKTLSPNGVTFWNPRVSTLTYEWGGDDKIHP